MNDNEPYAEEYIRLKPKLSSFKNLDRYLIALQDRDISPVIASRTKTLSISNIPEVYEFSKSEVKADPRAEHLSDLYKAKLSSVVTRHEAASLFVLQLAFALSMVFPFI